jgi:hypothetical protein
VAVERQAGLALQDGEDVLGARALVLDLLDGQLVARALDLEA